MDFINKELNSQLKSLINKKITHAKPGFGSFFTLDFGKDLEITYTFRGNRKTFIRGEWEIWVNMAFWKIEKKQEVILHNESEKEEMRIVFEKLVGKTFLNYEITSENFDMIIYFEDDTTLYLIANKKDKENEQWKFFLPKGKVFTAGPGTSLTYEDFS